MALADTNDVAARLMRPIVDELEKKAVEAWLDDVEEQIRTRYRDLDALVAAEEIRATTVISVEAAAVARVVRNPEGWRTFGFDDITRTRDNALSSGQVRIDPEEWAMLVPASVAAVASRGAYTVTVGTPL